MLTLIQGLPSFAVGITADGEITKGDFKTILIPALKKASEEWPGINLLMLMHTGIENFTVGAWLQDIKVNLTFFMKWNKIALVCNEDMLTKVSGFTNLFIPGEVKNFSLQQLQEAKQWICTP